LRAAAPVHQGGGKLKIGIVGIGGRGSGAAVQALRAHKENVLHAAGDAFVDRLENGLAGITEAWRSRSVRTRSTCRRNAASSGLDAIDKVLATGVDVVVLTTPPGFRPMQIEKAVAKGVHVFAEKPVATDAPGVRRVHAACELGEEEGHLDRQRPLLPLPRRPPRDRAALQEGGVGEILAIHGNYITGELWSFPRQAQWTEMEWQLRNWLYYPWLSGDHRRAAHPHARRDGVDQAGRVSGRRVCVARRPAGAHRSEVRHRLRPLRDHLRVGRRHPGFSYCRQQNNCWRDVNEYMVGTEGKANVFQHRSRASTSGSSKARTATCTRTSTTRCSRRFAGASVINNGDYMCKSTLMAIMGRMAAYTGQRITWEQAWNSQEVLMPADVTLDMAPPKVEIARPGITKFS
jgi:myo-inositol 2-dehydrogenase/D-chiro-inositol 1-dehydrogenase